LLFSFEHMQDHTFLGSELSWAGSAVGREAQFEIVTVQFVDTFLLNLVPMKVVNGLWPLVGAYRISPFVFSFYPIFNELRDESVSGDNKRYLFKLLLGYFVAGFLQDNSPSPWDFPPIPIPVLPADGKTPAATKQKPRRKKQTSNCN